MNTLNGMRVVVTRPFDQGNDLCKSINDLGGKAISFPTIKIDAIKSKSLIKLAQNINQFDKVIYISTNAVRFSLDYLKPSLLCNSNVVAIGEATRKELEKADIFVSVCPKDQFSSEQLLRQPEFNRIQNESILIIKGIAGRSFLLNNLRKLGAKVTVRNCYKRSLPKVEAGPIIDQYRQQTIDIFVVTSIMAFDNLCRLLKQQLRTKDLHSMQFLTISNRIMQYILDMGFKKNPVISINACNDSIVNSLLEWQTQRKHL